MTPLILFAVLLPQSADLMQEPDPARALDFWVGSWTCDSTRPQGEGKPDLIEKNAASNTITRELKDKVIHEHFNMPGFVGESWSVYGPRTGKWHQTWVDDGGGYITLEGGMEGDEFVLNGIFPSTNNRMRFTKITKDSFTWLWEQKSPSGEWQLSWQLEYKRK